MLHNSLGKLKTLESGWQSALHLSLNKGYSVFSMSCAKLTHVSLAV